MEGERILRSMKSSTSWETTWKDTQNYLNPLLKEEQSSHSNKRLLEYERFSYKLLKHCVAELISGSASLTVETVLKVSNLCVGSLEKSAGRTSKQKSLHFERLLLHLADGCRVAGDISECVKACRHLQGRLSSNIPEEAVLLQQTLEVLWLASPLRRLPPPTYSPAAPIPSEVLDHLSALVDLNLPLANLSLCSARNMTSKDKNMRRCKGPLWLGDAAFRLAVELGQQRQYVQACQVQEIVCEVLYSYCLQEGDATSILHIAQQAGLLGHLHYLARVCRKLHDAPASVTVLQRHLDMLPAELLGSEVVGIIHEELARAHLEMTLLTTWSGSKTRASPEGEEAERGSTGKAETKKTSSQSSLLKETSSLCLEPHEEASMRSSASLSHTLSLCVQSWEKMWLVVENSAIRDVLYKPADMLDDIYLTGLACAVYCLPLLALRACRVLLRLLGVAGEVLSEPDLESLRHKARALRDEICSSEDVKTTNYGSEGKAGGELDDVSVAQLSSRLARARHHLCCGQSSDCRAEILSVLDRLTSATCNCEEDYHCRGYCPQAMIVAATTRQLSSELLLHAPDTSSDSPPTTRSESVWMQTPVELAQDAMKLLWKMLDGYKSQIKSDSAHIGMLAYSNVWEVLLSLLRVIKWVCHLYMQQGCVEKAFNFLRETLTITKTLRLGSWYCEFLLLLGDLLVVRGDFAPTLLIAQQISRLLDCTEFSTFLTPPTDPMTPPTDSMTPPTSGSLLTSCSESVAGDNSLLLCQRVKAILLSCQVTLLDATSHVTHHVTRLLDVLKIADAALSFLSGQHQVDVGSVDSVLQPLKTKGSRRVKGRGGVKNVSGGVKNVSGGVKNVSGGVKNVSGAAKCVGKLDLVWADVVCLQAECQLLEWQSECAGQLVDEALDRLQGAWSCVDQLQLRLALARLHFLKGKSLIQLINGKQAVLADKEVWLTSRHGVRQCMSEFQRCYELCFPLRPAVLLREVCLWLAFLSTKCEDVHHYLSSSQQISLNHQTCLVLNAKMLALVDGGRRSSTWKQVESHVTDLRLALGTSQGALPATPPSAALVRARALCASPLPQPTSDIIAQLPSTWTFLTITLSPKPHPSCPSRLIITKVIPSPASKPAKPRSSASKKKRPVPVVKSEPLISSVLLGGDGEVEKMSEELKAVLKAANYGLDIAEKKTWWINRRNLDKRMKTCLENLDSLAPSEFPVLAGTGPVLLVLGRGLQHIPWETLPFLQDVPVVRTPSLLFATTHKAMVDAAEVWPVDVDSAYFVVNPQGDLKKTQELFGGRFSRQEGWEGVVSAPPTPEQLTQALESKSLYIYCGHGSGCGLSDESLRALPRCATSLIMGCRSAQLKECGLYDPTGHALNYLMAGCPAVVGCLWTVTDGDLDRFCDGLVTSLLEADPALLSSHVTRSRLKCRLRWLIGASAVVYGLPVLPQRQSPA